MQIIGFQNEVRTLLLWVVIVFGLGGSYMVSADTLVKPTSLEGESEFLLVDEAFRFSAMEVDDVVILSWEIAPGYYLYRQQLTLELTGAHGEPVIPDGVDKHDEYFGEVEVYFQTLKVTIPVHDTVENRRVSVTWQGCAEAGLCYPKQNREIVL